jgi:outer membrane protein
VTKSIVAALVAAALAATAAAQPQAGAQQERRYTLSAAAAEALDSNPAIAGAASGRDAASARLREAQSMWLPRAGVSETIMRSDHPVFVFGSLLEQGRFGAANFDPGFLNDPDPLTNFRLAVNVHYTLFDQFRRLNLGRQARNGVAQADFGLEDARQRIRSEVIARFYGIALAAERRDVATAAVGAAEADVSAMRDRFEQGLIVESDLLSAEVQLASFRQSLIEAEGDLAIARAALSTLLQRPVAEAVGVEGSMPEEMFPELPLAAAVERGLASRADVRIAESTVENASLQLKTTRGSLLPRVDTFATWGSSSQRFNGGNPDRGVGVIIGLDLFDGGRYARIAESRAGVEGARAAATAARDRATMEIVTAWHRTNSARERIALATRSAQSAEAAARIVRDRYENGLTTITEHLRAQTALLGARLELLAARYDYVVGYAELLRSTGGLNDVEAFT